METDHDKLIRLEGEVATLKKDVDDLTPIVRNLQAWQKTVLSITVLIGAGLTFFAEQVKHVLGLKG